jgi:peptidyl-prolyl cis-trans isomerase C
MRAQYNILGNTPQYPRIPTWKKRKLTTRDLESGVFKRNEIISTPFVTRESIIGKMNWKTSKTIKWILLIALGSVLLFACNGGETSNTPTVQVLANTATTEVGTTATPELLTYPTTEPGVPLAASVNGQGISMADYQAELERAQATSENGLIPFSDEDVLQNMIDEVLLAQGATDAGFNPDEALIQTRIDQLSLDEATIQDWLAENGYTSESFERALARAIAAAWMRDQIISTVPSTAEQVHARQILLYNADEAEDAYAELQAGTDFATLATQYDPLASGELGWFPRGYLTVSELDDPIFSLQPGEYTPIIETVLGFHIVQVIERDSQHQLSPGAYQTLQVQAIQKWLVERRNQSNIQILLS